MVHVALGARQHGVVVGNHHAAGGLRAEFFRVHGGDARNQPVGRRVHDEVVDLAPAALRSDCERAVFDERAFIDQLGDIFPRGALIGLAAALDRGRPAFVQRDGVARDQLSQIRADVVEIDILFFRDVVGVNLGRFEKQDRLVLHQGDAGFRRNPGHLAAMRCGHQMLHLHGFEHRDLLAGTDEVAFPDLDRDNRALQRCRHGDRSGRTGRAFAGLGHGHRIARFQQVRRRKVVRGVDEGCHMRINETGIDAVGDEIRMRQDRRQERNVGGDAANAELAERPRRLLHHVGPARAGRMHDHLGKQRIEGGAGFVTGTAERIDTDAGAGRQVEQAERAAGRLGGALLVHHFHVDAELHRIAARFRDVGLRKTERTQRGAIGDRELGLHEIDAEHLLGHGVLDLKPRIGFDEGEGLRLTPGIAIDQEFEGAEIVVVGSGRKLLGGLDDARAQGIIQRRARRHLDQLLVPPLNAAFTLP